MRQRLIFVHDESWLVAKRCTEAHELAKAERAEQLATVAGLLALVLETRGRDSEQADELLDRALAICTSWMVGELAVQPTKPSRVIEGLSSLRTRWLAGRRKPSVA